MSRSAFINQIVTACEKAGQSLMQDFGSLKALQISEKSPADFVSDADLKSQKILFEELMKVRHSFGFLGEEEGTDPNPVASARWIVDPLDGTRNFLQGIRHFAISVAVEMSGEITAGVIYRPASNELFWAEKDLGAYCNDKKLQVSKRSNLGDSLVGSGLGWHGNKEQNKPIKLRRLGAALDTVAGVRRMGAASLDLAYVATGFFDAYWESGLGPWDVAAGVLLVKEAGGYVAPMKQGENPVHTGALIATNAEIHDKFVKIIRDVK